MFIKNVEDLEEAAQALKTAVLKLDVEMALHLLKQTGGARSARELAYTAAELSRSIIGENFAYSITADGPKETITVYRIGMHQVVPVAGITFTS